MSKEVNWIKYHLTHLEFTRKTKPPFEQWEKEIVGSETRRRSDSWWRGDLYNQGVIWYGENMTSSIFDPNEWDTQGLKTFQNNASVCKRIEPKRRLKGLSFSHHAEVCYLDPEQFEDPARTNAQDLQDYYLKIALENKFGIRQLREKIKKDKGDRLPKQSLQKLLSGIIDKLVEWQDEAEGDVKELMTTAIHSLQDAAEIEKDN